MPTLEVPATRMALARQLERRAKLLGQFDVTAEQGVPAIPLAIPAGAHFALVQAQGGNVRWRADGQAPTATVGMLLYDGDSPTLFSENLSALQFFALPGATISVQYK